MVQEVALVTGGARRLGARFVRALADEGYRVAFSYHESQALAEALVDSLEAEGLEVAAFGADLRDEGECRALLDSVEEEWGPISCLVNNAAVLMDTGVNNDSVSDFDATIALNLRAPWMLSLSAGRRMRERGGGVILNIASVGGLRPYSSHLAYSVSKAGLIMLTRGLARDLAPEVRVNAIAPGMVELGEGDQAMPSAERVPLQSWARPEDLEDALLYLLEASHITGQILAVDGGWSLNS